MLNTILVNKSFQFSCFVYVHRFIETGVPVCISKCTTEGIKISIFIHKDMSLIRILSVTLILERKYNSTVIISTYRGENFNSSNLVWDVCRLQQPVQNPISDNTNVLWNSPSLGKNYSYRLHFVL